MPIPTYIEGFPQDGSSLGNTRVQIRNNLDGTFETLAVDHIDNNGNPGGKPPGYHNVIHFQDQGTLPTTPPTVSGVTQLYTNTDTHSIQQVIFETTAGNYYQQTTMLDAFRARFGTNGGGSGRGWTYLPGGLIMNYGFTSVQSSPITVTFSTLGLPTFSNTNYIINTTPYGGLTPQFNVSVIDGDSFRILYLVSSGSSGFYWTAIGIPS